jgi:maleate cis-trans isomerase
VTDRSNNVADSLGQRGKFGVLAPSTNTSVQPEYEAMRPWGITHHHSRLVIPTAGEPTTRASCA